jgi:hypothetical protein
VLTAKPQAATLYYIAHLVASVGVTRLRSSTWLIYVCFQWLSNFLRSSTRLLRWSTWMYDSFSFSHCLRINDFETSHLSTPPPYGLVYGVMDTENELNGQTSCA